MCTCCVQYIWWSCDSSSKVIKSDTFCGHSINTILMLSLKLCQFLTLPVQSASSLSVLIHLTWPRWEKKKELMGEIMELTRNLSIYQCVHQAHIHTHTHKSMHICSKMHMHSCVYLHVHGQMRMATRDLDGVDNETASDPVHLWSSVHYPNGHHSLLLITAPSLSLLRCSCRFSSRYLSAHLHQSADGFRGRWWDNKSEAAPSDYHHRDQLSTHSSTLKTPNVLIGNDTQLVRRAQWVSSGRV